MRIHFFQPEQFNRTENKTNPFFDPLIEVCQHNNIPYKVFIAEKQLTRNGYGNKAGNSWNLVLPEILGFRLIKWFQLPSRLVWYIAGFIINILTLGKYRADICITVAGIHLEILQGIAPKARLVDLQHGVIFPHHTGYFDSDGKLLPRLQENPQREYWLYGQGFKGVFLKNPYNHELLENKIFIVGNLLNRKVISLQTHTRNSIVFSLQYTDSLSQEQMKCLTEDIADLLGKIQASDLNKRYQIIMKHHPRYQNCYDLSSLQQKYPWIIFSTTTTEKLIFVAKFHITAYSTTAFDYALKGVPTLFFYDGNNPEGKEFLEGLHYNAVKSFDDMLEQLNDHSAYERTSQAVIRWAQDFYAEVDREQLMRILNLPE